MKGTNRTGQPRAHSWYQITDYSVSTEDLYKSWLSDPNDIDFTPTKTEIKTEMQIRPWDFERIKKKLNRHN